MPPPSKVLLVEDEPLVAMIAADALNELGFDVIEAPSARLALERLRANSAEVSFALVDMGLPDRPGEELIAEMMSLYPALRIIVASGYDAKDLRGRLNSPSQIVFLAKPYQRSMLEASINSLGIPRPPVSAGNG